MDLVTIAALVFAIASVVVSMIFHGNSEAPVRHAFTLLFPLALIAFPEAMEASFRGTFRGMAHGGEGPTPGSLLRFVAWGLLVILVVVHHSMGFARAAA